MMMAAAARAEAALRQAGIGGAVRTVSPVAPIASPMCRAADWTCLSVTTEADAVFVKLREADTADFITVADAAAGARTAARQGRAPAVRFALPAAGVMGFDLLQPPWREAGLADLAKPAVLQAVLSAKRALHGGAALTRRWDVFAQIEHLAAELPDRPADLPHLLGDVSRIQSALRAAGQDVAPCHADGTVSNIMLHPDGGVMLVDFDCAGMADPHYDMAVVLNEACVQDDQWQAGLEMAFDRPGPADFCRCRLYAIADDLLWGLWGWSRHALSQRGGVEFLKYASWRLLRCRMALGRSEQSDWLRRVG